ncbi:hypothetical protein ACQKQD_31830 [Methylobacterium sp. NPDC080182]|uniref:hypothetical protein n=1 Tax=Methylobacterium sp. NPDC080182 TaxID=3390590 RepID=UPI003CFFF596
MSPKSPTLAELRKAGMITSFEIVAAIDAYMQDATASPHRFASGHSLDVAMVVADSAEVEELRDGPGPKGKAFRNAVAVAVMAARPSPPECPSDARLLRPRAR